MGQDRARRWMRPLMWGLLATACSRGASAGGGEPMEQDPPGEATCPERPCGEGLACIAGQCRDVQEAPRCSSGQGGVDGCGYGQVCVETEQGSRCVAALPCDGDGDCPADERGSLCNVEEQIAGKDAVCIIGACSRDDHCPDAMVCAAVPGGVGRCGDGDFGAPCVDASQCSSGSCFAASSDRLGVCS